MRLRSLLFVPGDRPDRMEKALKSRADALILDLEDSVVLANKPKAREAVSQFVSAHARDHRLFVRINPLTTEFARPDLDAVLGGEPYGIVLPKAEGRESLVDLESLLGNSKAAILPIATETPKAVFLLGTYGGVTERLCGITWGAEDLPAAIGALAAREEDGRYTPPLETARGLTLFGAHAAGVPAIETVYPAYRDLSGLAAYAARGRRDGFSGMMAIHPDQVSVINAAFQPTEAEIAHAQQVVDLFAQNPGAGVLQLDGKMLDMPHLKAAQRLLVSWDKTSGT